MSLAQPGFRRIHKMRSFPFPFSLLSFPICFLDGMEKAYSQIAFLPVYLHFLFLSFAFPDMVLSFPCPFPCPFPFLSNMLFRLPGKRIFTNCIPYLSFSFFLSLSIALLSFPSFSWRSFPICFLEGLEKAFSQIAFLPLRFLFYSLSLLSLPFLPVLSFKIVTFLSFTFAFHFPFSPVLSCLVYSL